MRVSTDDAAWLVPPTRAIWVPPRVAHAIHMRGATAMRTLYLSPKTAADLPGQCRALEVSALLRELILHIVGGMLREGSVSDERLCGVLVDQLIAAETTPHGLPLPKNRRARSVAEQLLADPAAPVALAELAAGAAASLRTMQRLFARETGLSLDAWRTRARLQHGLVQLAAGASVTTAAYDCGYSSPSAFIAAFKAAFGVTPAKYRAGS
jgi:AraC-like DNA-binding protein